MTNKVNKHRCLTPNASEVLEKEFVHAAFRDVIGKGRQGVEKLYTTTLHPKQGLRQLAAIRKEGDSICKKQQNLQETGSQLFKKEGHHGSSLEVC